MGRAGMQRRGEGDDGPELVMVLRNMGAIREFLRAC
jgi:hypothetical protein